MSKTRHTAFFMFEYHFGPLALRSALELPELCKVGTDSPSTTGQATIVVDDGGLIPDFIPDHVDDRSAYEFMLDSATGIATMRHEGAVDYVISADLDHVTVRATTDIAASTVRHLLLDQVLPRLLEARGAFVLHASGVETVHGSMLFLGDSGSGKSSLAAEFERSGGRLLGDDCFTIEIVDGTISAATTYPSLRLLPDSIDEFLDSDEVTLSEVGENRPKQRVDQDRRLPPEAGTISAIFIIDLDTEHDGPPSVQALSARHGILQLVANSFRFHHTAAAAQQTLATAESILKLAPLYDLRYERRYEELSSVVATIMSTPEFSS